MTAARRPCSAALLVGSTSGTSAKVQSAGQSFKRFLASACTCPLPLPCRAPLEQRPEPPVHRYLHWCPIPGIHTQYVQLEEPSMSVPHALLALLSEKPKYGLQLQNE